MQLTYTTAEGQKCAFKLGEQPVVIGRGADVDLVLDDERISRRHCKLWVQDGVCLLEDLQSRNGTLVNSQPVTKVELTHGDQIGLGNRVLTFEAVKAPGMQTIFRQTAQDMNDGKGYGTILRKIVNNLDNHP